MELQKTGMEEIKGVIETTLAIPELDLGLLSKEVIEEEIKKHQAAYLTAHVSIKAEKKFLTDSIDEIEKLHFSDPNGLETARKHLEKAKANPKYFQETKVDPSCYSALGNLQNIEAKIQEVKTQLWTIKYHSQKIAEVKEYLSQLK